MSVGEIRQAQLCERTASATLIKAWQAIDATPVHGAAAHNRLALIARILHQRGYTPRTYWERGVTRVQWVGGRNA